MDLNYNRLTKINGYVQAFIQDFWMEGGKNAPVAYSKYLVDVCPQTYGIGSMGSRVYLLYWDWIYMWWVWLLYLSHLDD